MQHPPEAENKTLHSLLGGFDKGIDRTLFKLRKKSHRLHGGRPLTNQKYAGDQKLANHGDSLLAMINGYLKENNVTLAGDFPWEEDQGAQVREGQAGP